MNKKNLLLFLAAIFFFVHGIEAAVTTDGSTGYVDFGNSSALNPPAMTVSVWIVANNFTPAYAGVVSMHGGSTYYQILLKSDGKLAVYLVCNNPSTFYDNTGVYTLSTGVPYNVAFTYDSVSGLKGYVNGLLDGTSPANGPIQFVGMDLALGNDIPIAGRFFNGKEDDLRIYKRALSAQEIMNIASSHLRYPDTDGLILWAPLDNLPAGTPAFGTLVLDKSQNHFNGVIVGTVNWTPSNFISYP